MKRNVRAFAPSFLTVTNILLGFGAIVAAANHSNYQLAAVLIITAAVIDALDGKVARFMNSSCDFGRELDSLADVVSFGVAPAYLIYASCFAWLERGNPAGNLLAIAVAATPLVFGALRLARFNLVEQEGEHRDSFAGLPIPAAAVTLTSFILFNYRIWGRMELAVLMVPLVLGVSLLMASRVSYQAMPRLTFRDTRHNLIKLIIVLAGVLALIVFKSLALFPLTLLYLLVGIIRSLHRAPVTNQVEEEDAFNDTVF